MDPVVETAAGGEADVFSAIEAAALARVAHGAKALGTGAEASAAPAGVPADEFGRIQTWLSKNSPALTANAAGEDLELSCIGVIGSSFSDDAVSARRVRQILDAHKDAKSIRVLIDSPGGDYFDGVAIMNMLKRHPAHVTVEVIGEATSAGSVIAMGGNRIEMHTGTMMMIHRAWTLAMGNSDELRSGAEMLDKVDAGLIQIYAARTGKKPDYVQSLVNATTWMTAKEAIAAGFADVELPTAKRQATKQTSASSQDTARALAMVAPAESPATQDPAVQVSSPEKTTPEPEETGPKTFPKNPGKEQKNMSDNNIATPAVARAMGLPAGAAESDMVAAATRLRELEIGVMTLVGVSNSAEALGAVRGLKASADSAAKQAEELAAVKAERDKQNFEALIMKGTSAPIKLSPATKKLYEDRFDDAVKNGRGADVVNDLSGFLAVAPTIIHTQHREPAAAKTSAVAGAWNGKTFAELKPAQRAQLKSEDAELYAMMRRDWEQSRSA